MKNLIIILLLITATSVIGSETDNAGYTENNESAARVAADKAWDAAQDEFDKPNP